MEPSLGTAGPYGSRVHEFRKSRAARLVDADFELALDIDPAEVDDLRTLDADGWRLVDPTAVAGTPGAYATSRAQKPSSRSHRRCL